MKAEFTSGSGFEANGEKGKSKNGHKTKDTNRCTKNDITDNNTAESNK
jgi:hypothetical protein